MKRRSLFGTLTAVTASLALAGTVLAAGSFTNGSFEDGGYVESNSNGFMSGASGTVITGWTITTPVDWIDWYWNAAEGTKSIDMNASPSEGSLYQTFATAVNSTYVIQFQLAGNPTYAPGLCDVPVKTLTLQAGSGPTTTYQFDTTGHTPTTMGWTTQAYSFATTSQTSATMTFTSTTPGYCGPAIDAVTVTETLATGALCKKGGWVTMFDNVGNMFKNQGDCVSYYATDGKNLGAITP